MKNAHSVVIILEAKPDKISELKKELMNVVGPSRSEKTCLEYRLHQDQENPAKFISYENWESKEAHQQQFQKSYIINLINKIEPLMAKPYQVIFANEILL